MPKSKKGKKNPKLIALKIRSQAKSETGKFILAEIIRNILHEAHIIAAQPKENNTQAGLTERSQFAMVKNMKMIAMNFGGRLFSQMKGNVSFFKSDWQEKVWRRKNCELDDKNLTATMLNTMDNGAAGALNDLGDLCFIDDTMDHYLYINILKSHLAKS